MTYPVFASGDVLNASDMNAVGLWLVKSQTIGSAVSSVTVTGAFSSNYQNYKIIAVGGAPSASMNIALTLGSAVTGYYYSMSYVDYVSTTVSGLRAQNTTSWVYGGFGTNTTTGLSVNCDVMNPFTAHATIFRSWIAQNKTDGFSGYSGGYLADTTSYTAFTLTASTGTITGGTIHVFGYND